MIHVYKNIVASIVLALIGINCALALGISTQNIPSRAYDPNNRKKVVICHFPPGNPANYQTISISVNSLDTHVDHHSDTFAVDGVCPNLWQVPSTYNQTTGKPDTLSSTKCGVTSDMLDSVIKRLPEGSDVSAKSPELITDDKGANIFLKADAKVKVAFVYDGAGYSNSLGYFSTTSPSGLTRQNAADKIIYTNFSKPSEGSLSLGDTVDLGSFTSGSMIGFTIVSNGWSGGVVDPTRNVTQIFRTVKSLNPETSDANRAHTVLLSDAKSGILLLGIEDLNRDTCSYNDYGYCTDDDFNDAVIGICVDPPSAISNIKDIPTLELPKPEPPVEGKSGPANWSEINMPIVEKK